MPNAAISEKAVSADQSAAAAPDPSEPKAARNARQRGDSSSRAEEILDGDVEVGQVLLVARDRDVDAPARRDDPVQGALELVDLAAAQRERA